MRTAVYGDAKTVPAVWRKYEKNQVKTGVKTLGAKGEYLNLSLLRPGDVILTFPAGLPLAVWQSYAITYACGGSYSHAILVLTPTLWYESEDRGVGPTAVNVDRVEMWDGTAHLLKRIDQWAECSVFRHPEARMMSDEKLLSILAPVTEQLSYREYPSFTRIARDLEVLEYLPLRNRMLQLVDDKIPFDVNRGLFCSEVVAFAYQELKFPFTKLPHQVRPSDIADVTVSRMKQIEPFCDADPSARTLDHRVFNLVSEQTFRDQFVGNLTRLNTSTAALEHFVTRSEKAAIRAGVPADRLSVEGFPKTISDLLTSLVSLCEETNRFLLAVGTTLTVDEEDSRIRTRLEDGIRVLDLPQDAVADGIGSLIDMTDTYCDLVKPNTQIHSGWRPVLSAHYLHSEKMVENHLDVASGLSTEFANSQGRMPPARTRDAMGRFVLQTQKIVSLFGGLKEKLGDCRIRIEA